MPSCCIFLGSASELNPTCATFLRLIIVYRLWCIVSVFLVLCKFRTRCWDAMPRFLFWCLRNSLKKNTSLLESIVFWITMGPVKVLAGEVVFVFWTPTRRSVAAPTGLPKSNFSSARQHQLTPTWLYIIESCCVTPPHLRPGRVLVPK